MFILLVLLNIKLVIQDSTNENYNKNNYTYFFSDQKEIMFIHSTWFSLLNYSSSLQTAAIPCRERFYI